MPRVTRFAGIPVLRQRGEVIDCFDVRSPDDIWTYGFDDLYAEIMAKFGSADFECFTLIDDMGGISCESKSSCTSSCTPPGTNISQINGGTFPMVVPPCECS